MAMGSPLGPTFANAFLSHHEIEWLENCPKEFKPLVYKRYIDDCFLVFKTREESLLFFNYLNSRHSNITFTQEIQTNNSLSFLDVKVSFEGGKFVTSTYRKPTVTLLGTNYFSFVPFKFVLSGIKSRIFRSFKINSTWLNFHKDMEYISKFAKFNFFPKDISQKLISEFLREVFCPKLPIPTVPKQKIYLKLPYIGSKTYHFINILQPILKRTFTSSEFIFIPVNNYNIASFFRFKEKIPDLLRSSLIYSFNCTSCQASYVGQTGLQLKVRISKHAGKSFRTGRYLSSPEESSIRSHAELNHHRISESDFKILTLASTSLDRRILESLCIKQLKPNLNIDNSSIVLYNV